MRRCTHARVAGLLASQAAGPTLPFFLTVLEREKAYAEEDVEQEQAAATRRESNP